MGRALEAADAALDLGLAMADAIALATAPAPPCGDRHRGRRRRGPAGRDVDPLTREAQLVYTVTMADSHALALDTPPELRRLQTERWAATSSVRKAEMVRALCRDVRAIARAGARLRFPDASPREQLLRVGALTIERELMIEAFGWDPAREGR